MAAGPNEPADAVCNNSVGRPGVPHGFPTVIPPVWP